MLGHGLGFRVPRNSSCLRSLSSLMDAFCYYRVYGRKVARAFTGKLYLKGVYFEFSEFQSHLQSCILGRFEAIVLYTHTSHPTAPHIYPLFANTEQCLFHLSFLIAVSVSIFTNRSLKLKRLKDLCFFYLKYHMFVLVCTLSVF